MRFLSVFRCSLVALTASLGFSGLIYAAPHDGVASHSSRDQQNSESIGLALETLTQPEQARRILRIFQRTQAAIRLHNFPVATSISMTPSPHASAFVYKQRNILLSEPLVELLQSEEQLAFAISHEMAHIALGHTSKAGAREELAADAFAVAVLAELGMDSCASTSTLETLKNREPLYKELLSHRQEHLQKTVLSHCSWRPAL